MKDRMEASGAILGAVLHAAALAPDRTREGVQQGNPSTADRAGPPVVSQTRRTSEDQPDVLAERVGIHTVTRSNPPRWGFRETEMRRPETEARTPDTCMNFLHDFL